MRATPTLREWLLEAPFSLALSSGFFGFFAHAGVVRALEEANLRPRRITGSSAGALVGALWAAGMSAERMRAELERVERADFWDPAVGPGLLRGERLQRRLEALVPVPRIEQTAIPVGISVFDLWSRQTVVLERGDLATAIRASCAVPLMFRPVWVGRRAYLDGGVRDRPGLFSVPEGERTLYHHLPSSSPWGWPRKLDRGMPQREGMASLVIDGLPRVDPFRLPRGPQAYARGLEVARRLLAEPATQFMTRGAVQA